MPQMNYIVLLIMIAAAGAAGGLLWVASRRHGNAQVEPGKSCPAESGNLNQEAAWRRYHVRYYGYALLFLAFDMEMAYMYPWAVVYNELGLMALLDMGVFLMILFLGLLYAWSQGGLKRQ
mgnify:CR=1 FL=1